MTGMIVRMQHRDSLAAPHIRIWPNGDTDYTNSGTTRPVCFSSQLIAIRHFMFAGWEVTTPKLWEEAES